MLLYWRESRTENVERTCQKDTEDNLNGLYEQAHLSDHSSFCVPLFIPCTSSQSTIGFQDYGFTYLILIQITLLNFIPIQATLLDR